MSRYSCPNPANSNCDVINKCEKHLKVFAFDCARKTPEKCVEIYMEYSAQHEQAFNMHIEKLPFARNDKQAWKTILYEWNILGKQKALSNYVVYVNESSRGFFSYCRWRRPHKNSQFHF